MNKSLAGSRRSQRGMSSATAVVVLVITIVVLGAISFVVFNSVTTTHTCAPADSPVCTVSTNTHDVTILAPFLTAQQDQLIPFTVLLPSGETASSYMFNFGDGSTASSNTPTVTHSYTNPGTYLVYAQALVKGTWHDNLAHLQGITISASHVRDTLGTQPGITGSLNSNTSSAANPTAVLAPGGTITVSGGYSSNSSSTVYGVITPSLIVSTGGALGTPTTSTSSLFVSASNPNGVATVTNSVSFAKAGIYTVTYVAGVQQPSSSTPNTNPVYYQNYTWTAYVSSPSGAAVVPAQKADPHPGTVIAYEYAPGGAEGEDPAVDYETLGYEVIVNVYQKLIDYNGSKSIDSPNGYIPVIATCVPGSSQCGQQFPTEPSGDVNLVDGYNYTFVIGDTMQFYDPATGAHWPVYASDVLFSIARSIAMSSDGEATPGWVQGQSLLPFGNASYDAGIHYPYNSTPANIFAHILVNDSSFCPTTAMTPGSGYDGCVTFVANGSGTTAGAKPWPFFLELMSAIGSSIVPAGWFSAQGSVLPGWTNSSAYQGDHPVALPGGATSSTSSAFQTAVGKITDTDWDTMISDLSENDWGNVQYNMVGSGPYYLAGYTIGTSYTLKANPAYNANPSCTTTYIGTENYCYPAAGSYPGTIDVTWEVDPTPGEAALASGVADMAGIPTTQTALALQLIQEGKAAATIFPSISIFFFPFDLNFSSTAALAYPTGPITVPSNWFTYIGMRQFFATAYPYQTSESTVNTVGGIEYGFNYGGVIPDGMGNYYPTNISWPNTDPATNTSNPASPAYWWAQMQDPSSPYYDPEVASCTVASPCQLPFFGQTGAPNYDQALALEVQEVSQFSGGRIVIHTLDINFIQLVLNSLYSGPGGNPMPIYTLAWAPDYPDPTDYIGAMYYPNGTYTYSDAYSQFSAQNGTIASYCVNSPTYNWSDLLYWAGAPVNETCQGAAYTVMTQAFYQAAITLNLNERALIYNVGEQVAKKLALYIYFYQENVVYFTAPWVNGASIDEQVTLGGGMDTMWFWLNGNGMVP